MNHIFLKEQKILLENEEMQDTSIFFHFRKCFEKPYLFSSKTARSFSKENNNKGTLLACHSHGTEIADKGYVATVYTGRKEWHSKAEGVCEVGVGQIFRGMCLFNKPLK